MTERFFIGRVDGIRRRFHRGDADEWRRCRGELRLHDLSPGLDGSVVLRYHSVPYLTTSPPVAFEPEYREDDPVPFIRLRPPPGTSDVELELQSPGRALAARVSRPILAGAVQTETRKRIA